MCIFLSYNIIVAQGVAVAEVDATSILLSAGLGPDQEADTLTILGSILSSSLSTAASSSPSSPPPSQDLSSARALSSLETLEALGVRTRDTLYITSDLEHLKTILGALADKGPSATIVVGE
jgi:hypothetical protein